MGPQTHAFVQALGRLIGAGLRTAVRAGRNMLVGGALGVFVGFLIALAAQSSPIVASVTASTMALVTAYGAFRVAPVVTAADENLTETRVNVDPNPAWIIIGFGLFAATGVLAGIYLRANQILSPSPQAEVQRWESAGFSREQALCLTAASFGYAFARGDAPSDAPSSPSAFQACVTLSMPPELAVQKLPVLLNDEVTACQTLDGMKFLTLRDAESALRPFGSPWSEIYDKAARAEGTETAKLAIIHDNVHQRCIRVREGESQ